MKWGIPEGEQTTGNFPNIFVRKGLKLLHCVSFLDSGSPAFSSGMQTAGREDTTSPSKIHVFILCDWNTAWSLLYNPIALSEKEEIKKELAVSLLENR